MRFKPLYTAILAASTMLASCGDFLERTAQDLVIPTEASQYKELLQGEGYFKEFNSHTYFLNYMTDDMQYIEYQADEQYTNSAVTQLKGVYCWLHEIENDEFTDELFSWCYEQILAANTCLDALDDMAGSDTDKQVLEGQSLFQRAYSYFILVNAYGYKYTGNNADVACLPLRLDPTPSSSPYTRESSRVIWNQIESDITRSAELLKDYTPVSKYEINYYAALLLAARTELYMEKYAEAEQFASTLLELKPDLYDISGKLSVEPSNSTTAASVGFIDYNSNPEILWNFCSRDDATAYSLYKPNMISEHIGFRISQAEPDGDEGTIIGAYAADIDRTTNDQADRRKSFFFNLCAYLHADYEDSDYAEYGSWMIDYMYAQLYGMPAMAYDSGILKYDPKDSNNTLQQAFRTGEAYLILAEAYARQANPDAAKAIGYLNTLRRNRINGYTDLAQSDFSSNDELVKFIFDERRRELCFEECHRFWDLKRYDQPSLTHKYLNNETYVLSQEDEAYTLSAPQLERNFDNSIVNRRPVRAAQ